MTDKTPEEIAYGHNKGDHVVSPYSDPDVVKNGFTYGEGRELGIIGPNEASEFKLASVAVNSETELGESAMQAIELRHYPDKIEIHDPSDATVKNWDAEYTYRYTSDGTRWLCALDSNGSIFSKVKATSDIDANNTDMLLRATQPILNHFRGIKGQQSLGLEEPKDIAA
jgi:hypothetical protein